MSDRKTTVISTVFVILSNVIFGVSFLLSKLCMNVASPFIMLSFRFFIALVIMGLMTLMFRFRLTFKLTDIWPLIGLAFLEPVLYFFCESYGIQLISTSIAGTLLALIPVAGMLLGLIFLHERPTAFQAVCAIASVGGVALTTIGQSDATGFNIWGVVLLLGGVMLSGAYIVTSRKLSEKYSSFERTFMQFAVGFIVFTGLAVVENRNDLVAAYAGPASMPEFIIPVALLAAFASVGAFLMVNFALNKLDVMRVSIAANITTVVSIIAGVLFLDEVFGLWQIIGSVVIILCVLGVECVFKPRLPKVAADKPE